MNRLIKFSLIALTALALHGCGDDDNKSGAYTANDHTLPAGTATLAFTATSTARLPSSVNGIRFSVKLPPGMGITTESGSSRIDAGSVHTGSALQGTSVVLGTYSSSTRTANLIMVTSGNAFRSGEFLRLGCTVLPNTSITVADLKAINNPVSLFEAVGYDPISASTTVLTGKIKVDLDVVQ